MQGRSEGSQHRKKVPRKPARIITWQTEAFQPHVSNIEKSAPAHGVNDTHSTPSTQKIQHLCDRMPTKQWSLQTCAENAERVSAANGHNSNLARVNGACCLTHEVNRLVAQLTSITKVRENLWCAGASNVVAVLGEKRKTLLIPLAKSCDKNATSCRGTRTGVRTSRGW
jgi:hypothetical protein